MDEKNIPEYVIDIMNSIKTLEFNADIEKRYSLVPDQTHQLAILEGKILYKELPLFDLLMAIKNQLNLDEEKAKLIAFEICQNLFLPAQPYLLGVKELMVKLKSDQPRTTNPNIVDLKNQ